MVRLKSFFFFFAPWVSKELEVFCLKVFFFSSWLSISIVFLEQNDCLLGFWDAWGFCTVGFWLTRMFGVFWLGFLG